MNIMNFVKTCFSLSGMKLTIIFAIGEIDDGSGTVEHDSMNRLFRYVQTPFLNNVSVI